MGCGAGETFGCCRYPYSVVSLLSLLAETSLLLISEQIASEGLAQGRLLDVSIILKARSGGLSRKSENESKPLQQ